MPQMSPMGWMYLYMYFLFFKLLFYILNFYCFKKKIYYMNFLYFVKKWIWKW